MIFSLLSAVFGGIIVYYIIFLIRHKNYWKDRGIPGPKSRFFLGNVWETMNPTTPFYSSMVDKKKEYGKIWGYQEGVHNILVVADGDIAHEVLLTRYEEFQRRKHNYLFEGDGDIPRMHMVAAWGQRWKRMRTIVNPQFTANSLKKILPTIEDSVRHLLVHLDKKADGEMFNIHSYYQEYTMDIIARIAMGQKKSEQWNTEYTAIMKEVFSKDYRDPFFLAAIGIPIIQPFLREFFFFLSDKLNLPVSGLLKTIEKAVEKRKKERETERDFVSRDFIDLFLDAEADVDLTAEKGGEYNRKEVHVSRKLTTDEVIMNLFLFLLAGFDTTSNSLAYLSHFLTLNPEVMRKMQEEIDQVCTDEDISYEQVSELKYMDCAVKEALRLHPLGAAATCRYAMSDLQLADIQIEKGTIVQIDAYSINRDEEIWGANACEFIPERWMELTKEQSNAFLSFGAGPRMCVGMRLAYLEEKLALAHILTKYDILRGKQSQNHLQLHGSLTVSPVAVNVHLKRREK